MADGLPGAVKAALAGLFACAALAAPFVAIPGPELPGLTPFFCAWVFVTEAATALLLFVRFRGDRARSTLELACAWFFSAVMALLYMATFPAALRPGGPAIGAAQTASWVFAAWTIVLAGLANIAALIDFRRPAAPLPTAAAAARAARIGAAATAALLIGLALLVQAEAPLPALVEKGRWTGLFLVLHVMSTALMLSGVLLIVAGPGRRSDLFAWLSVALMAMAVANILAALGGERYSLGWTAARIGFVLAAGVLFGFFVRIFARQQRALAAARDRLEGAVARRTAELSQMVAERDALLGEVYHRVNNNLQIIGSLLRLERRLVGDPEARAAFERMERRTLGIGLVHRRAMDAHRIGDVDLGAVLDDLAGALRETLASTAPEVRLKVRAAPLRGDFDVALAMGLLAQELVLGAAAQAQPAGSGGGILVTLDCRDGRRCLTVSREARAAGPWPDAAGARIVRALVAQLGGAGEFAPDSGPSRRVLF